jgi:carboxyl-terminal processing protease
MRLRRLIQFLLPPLATLAALGLAGCAAIPPPAAFLNYVAPAGKIAPADRPAFNARVLDQVAGWVGRRYFDPAFHGVDWPAACARHRPAVLAARNDDELYAALNSLLDELGDVHTHALKPREIEELHRRQGVLIGFRIGPVVGQPTQRRVVLVYPGSPAALAGVQAGWRLVAADGRPPAEVLGLGKLAQDQLVQLDFLDAQNQPRHLALRARKLTYPPIRDARRLPGNVLLLAFDTFDLSAARWVRAQLKAAPPAGGLILDLRNNSGGETRALAAILAEVFPDQVDLGHTRARGDDRSDGHRSPRHPFAAHYRGPFAVLVSEGSASAAEIFAAVVQQQRRGPVLGTATPGKVLVAVNWPLPGGGELQLSVYDYVAPDGRRLEGRGITPDLVVQPAPGAEPDPQIEAALAALRRP